MKVVEVRNIEDCFDGSLIKELRLSSKITKELIFHLGTEGKVQYFSHFQKPFFKIRVPGIFDVKGIEGNLTMRVHLKAPQTFSLGMFIKLLEKVPV